MKLFSRTEIKKDQQSTLEAIREEEFLATERLQKRLKELNAFEEDYSKRTHAKRVELAQVELELQTFLAHEQREVRLLEECRQQALAPISAEIQALQTQREEVEGSIHSLAIKQEELTRNATFLRQKETEINRATAELTAFRQESADYLALQEQKVRELHKMSASTIEALQNERELTQKVVAEAEQRQKSAERAEQMARGAMRLADQKIAQEREEQHKTDAKRRLLASALKIAKAKGINTEAYG